MGDFLKVFLKKFLKQPLEEWRVLGKKSLNFYKFSFPKVTIPCIFFNGKHGDIFNTALQDVLMKFWKNLFSEWTNFWSHSFTISSLRRASKQSLGRISKKILGGSKTIFRRAYSLIKSCDLLTSNNHEYPDLLSVLIVFKQTPNI